jgi:DNA-binding PadR family transcriptional regulator
VKYGLLALLNRQSMHGYELRRELEDELGQEWAVNYGQIYTTLERLLRGGLVVQSETVQSAEAPDRKLYTVTPAGRSQLRQWFLTPIGGAETGRDELFAKILLSMTGDVEIDDVIQVERKAQLRRIGQLTELKEQRDPKLELSAVLQLDMSIMKTEALIRWLDTAESKIRKTAGAEADGVTLGRRPEPSARDEATDSIHDVRKKERR